MLETERLILRQWKDEDYPLFAEMNSDDEVMKYFPEKLNVKESNNFADKLKKLISERGWGLWALEIKQSKQFVGFTGLHYVNSVLPFSPALEIGWRLNKQFWSRGYATEAALCSLQFAFNTLNVSEIVSLTSVINEKSQSVMKRLNMINTNKNFFHPLIDKSNILCEHVLYKITKSEWKENGKN